MSFVWLWWQRWEGPQIRGEDIFNLGGEERLSRGGDCPVQSRFEQEGEGAREAEGEGEGKGEREGERKRKSSPARKWYVFSLCSSVVVLMKSQIGMQIID